MTGGTGIQWTDETWNPIRGCSRVSEGCRNCYAESVARRFAGPGQPYEGLAHRSTGKRHRSGWTGDVRLFPEKLDQPLRWQRPRRIFVNSMSDLFHEKLSDEGIDRVFAVMALAPRHTFQVLTKRPDRMRDYCAGLASRAEELTAWMDEARERMGWTTREEAFSIAPPGVPCTYPRAFSWPLPNVWLGVSVEDQSTADARIPLLRDTPAAVRFVSYEPALGPVDFSRFMWPVHDRWPATFRSPEEARAAGASVTRHRQALVAAGSAFLDWIIVGGESGPGSRPCDVAWIRFVVEQCRDAGVACFVKQLGAHPDFGGSCHDERLMPPVSAYFGALKRATYFRDHKGGDPSEWPEDLRVRQFPAVPR